MKSIVAIGVGGVVAGGVIGYILTNSFMEPEIITVEPEIVKEELTDQELENLCQHLTDAEKKNVLEVQKEVSSLQSQIQNKEAEIEELKAKIYKDEASKAAAQKKWKAMEKELASLQIQLAAAEKERDDLKVELKETLVKLDQQIVETQKYKAQAKKYKTESTENLWAAFTAQAKVHGCDRGSKKRHEKCHEAFDTAMNSTIEQRFLNCVDTYQAIPVLQTLEKGEALPPFSVYLNKESKFTEDWVVVFCDPTLPEAKDADTTPSYTPPRQFEEKIENEKDLDFDLDLDLDQ